MQRLARDDRGAVAVLVAVLMMALVGMAALVVDVGQLYAERRQLQNGADAAVLSVVLDCATTTGCPAGTAAAAAAKADQNANDGTASVASPSGPAVCGNGVGLAPCAPVSGLGAWDCRPVPSGALAANYVQVRTQTRAAGGGTLLPPILAGALPGNAGSAGSTVRACARASWGGAAGLTGLSVTMSYCEWDVATAGGTSYAPAPPYPPNPPASVQRVLKLHTTTTGSCPTGGHAGSDGPGAFGWLDETGPCTSEVTAGGTFVGDPGVSTSGACKTALQAATTAPYTVLEIPIYDSVTGTGAGTTYHLKGFAAFVLTGYRLPGANKASWLTGGHFCSGSDKCLYGFFTQALTPVSGVVGGPSMGVTVVQMSG